MLKKALLLRISTSLLLNVKKIHLSTYYSLPVPFSLFDSTSGPPQRVLSSFLHSFVDSSRSGIPLHPTPLPLLGLSQGDKQCIRDRSSIMARHIFADKSEEFINAQVGCSLFGWCYMVLIGAKLHS